MVTVLNDSSMSIRTAIEQWMGGMEDYEEKFGYISPSQYQRDIEVFQLDRNGNVLKAYRLFDAFPFDVSPVALDFAQNDTISSFSVTFHYQHFEVTNNPAGSIINFAGIFNQ